MGSGTTFTASNSDYTFEKTCSLMIGLFENAYLKYRKRWYQNLRIISLNKKDT